MAQSRSSKLNSGAKPRGAEAARHRTEPAAVPEPPVLRLSAVRAIKGALNSFLGLRQDRLFLIGTEMTKRGPVASCALDIEYQLIQARRFAFRWPVRNFFSVTFLRCI